MQDCPRCGAQIGENEWRCAACGAVFAQDASLLPTGAVIDPNAGRRPKRRASDRGESAGRPHRHPHRRENDPATIRDRLRETFGLDQRKRQHRLKIKRTTAAALAVGLVVLVIAVYMLGRMAG